MALWERTKESIRVGMVVEGKVVRHEHYGFFVDLGLAFEGLVQIVDITDRRGRLDQRDFPPIGSTVVAVVIGFKDALGEIVLSTKESLLAASQTK